MRIAFLTYGAGRQRGSIGKFIWYLTYELRKLDFEVDIISASYRIRKFGPLIYSFKNVFEDLHSYDLIHSNEGAGLFVSHPSMVETYHHDYMQVPEVGYRLFNILENLECKKVKHIIVPSYASKNTLMHYGFSPDKVSLIHHGVDHNYFYKNNTSRSKTRLNLGLKDYFVVINVGRFAKHKRQIDLIAAMSKIPNSVLILVGKGPEESNIINASLRMGVKVLFFNDVSENFLADLYNAADVYVHTSILEGFCLTVLEAMSCGLPIIAYNVADFEDMVGPAGYLVEAGNISRIRSGLLFMMANSETRFDMSRNAILQSGKFLWSEVAKKHADIYKKVLRY